MVLPLHCSSTPVLRSKASTLGVEGMLTDWWSVVSSVAAKSCQTAYLELPSKSAALTSPLVVLVTCSVTLDSSLTLLGLNQLALFATSVLTLYSLSGNLTACPGT